MAQALKEAALTRKQAIWDTSEAKRNELAQHLTPPETAELAVSMFSPLKSNQFFIRCLDLGAGTGILSVALYERYDGHIERIDAVETDPILATIYEAEMTSIDVPHDLIVGDALIDTPSGRYDRIILNPPYKKMGAKDLRQNALPCHSANLYSAFVAVGLSHLADDGELVAIIPRSWMNGDYFTQFRRYALDNFSLDAIHLYGSRTEVFADTNVLQETMIARFSKRKQADVINVAHSNGKCGNIETAAFHAKDLIDPLTYVVRIAPEDSCINETIESMKLCPSTGKVIDFRSRERTFEKRPNSENAFPLLYAGNFSKGKLQHPASIGKPQWYVADDERSKKQLLQPGSYVIVKRFSAKEERRRVVARPLISNMPIALENHLNFIHAGTSRHVASLGSRELAQGLAIWLNSTFIDDWFRDVSGSTQVNAKDIKAMPCPSLTSLEQIGRLWRSDLEQNEIDCICEVLQ